MHHACPFARPCAATLITAADRAVGAASGCAAPRAIRPAVMIIFAMYL
jgi:hypothetical protein